MVAVRIKAYFMVLIQIVTNSPIVRFLLKCRDINLLDAGISQSHLSLPSLASPTRSLGSQLVNPQISQRSNTPIKVPLQWLRFFKLRSAM